MDGSIGRSIRRTRGGDAAIARIRWRLVSFEAAFVVFEIAHQIGEIGIPERVAIRRHKLATLPDLFDHSRIADGLSRAQFIAFEDVFQRGSGFRVLVVAVPALVIVDLFAALRTFPRAGFHLEDFCGTLVRILRGTCLAVEGAR